MKTFKLRDFVKLKSASNYSIMSHSGEIKTYIQRYKPINVKTTTLGLNSFLPFDAVLITKPTDNDIKGIWKIRYVYEYKTRYIISNTKNEMLVVDESNLKKVTIKNHDKRNKAIARFVKFFFRRT